MATKLKVCYNRNGTDDPDDRRKSQCHTTPGWRLIGFETRSVNEDILLIQKVLSEATFGNGKENRLVEDVIIDCQRANKCNA